MKLSFVLLSLMVAFPLFAQIKKSHENQLAQPSNKFFSLKEIKMQIAKS
ncbi:hypothetical protein V6255_17540 [Psychromonas arctica]|uniref:Uncharacterized protein n=1 Tax=Psychromonas arctica TaxID=168275 RepID=A0ABU9HH56_9GAMM